MNIDYNSLSLNEILQYSIRSNWNLMSLIDMGGQSYQYKGLAEQVEKLHILFEAASLKKGDRIAICGKNSANWFIIFLACLTYGITAVPILHEFKSDTIQHLVNHSASRLFFVDEAIWKGLDEKSLPGLEAVIFISEFGMPLCRNKNIENTRSNINEIFGERHPYSYDAKDIFYQKEDPDSPAIINYTSGSTGLSKGVVLPYRSILNNIRYCVTHLDFLFPGDGIVNMLPLAHMYGMIVETLHPICKGCTCHFLTKLPSPKVILQAFAEVKPKLIITVPLVIEKIIKSKVFPIINKPLMKILLKVPYVGRKLLAKIKKGLEKAFGGNLHELIIGGAALNTDVEHFLRQIDFPFTVGYGMTECGPLISYSPPGRNPFRSCGRLVDNMEAKVDSPDPENIPGDLWVRGLNVMVGYLDNDDATREVMDEDGWMNTGDMCIIDKDGFITICGRSKTMILGPSGQNIYPEEIEQKLNNLPYVNECLVIEDQGKLVALIYPDYEKGSKEGIHNAAMEELMIRNIQQLNKELPSFSRISHHKLTSKEFEKTPKRSIKRYLYQV